MQRLKPGLDIVLDVLIAVAEAYPHNTFAQSILHQYRERGGLSKKQLQGLYGKAENLPGISVQKLATLEAIIKRKPAKERSALPETTPLYSKDEETGKLIQAILKKYPAHKRVLFLQTKYDNNEILFPAELTELKKFSKLV
jgi:hypothetical protein